MTTNGPAILSSTDLEGIVGGKGLGFPAAEAGQALGMGIEGTFKAANSPSASGFHDMNRSYNPMLAVPSFFSNTLTGSPPGSTYSPATMNPGGSITPGTLTPP
jgi:hypothetical protein